MPWAIRLIPADQAAQAAANVVTGLDEPLWFVYPRPLEYPEFRVTGITGPIWTTDDPGEAVVVLMDLVQDHGGFLAEVVEVCQDHGSPRVGCVSIRAGSVGRV